MLLPFLLRVCPEVQSDARRERIRMTHHVRGRLAPIDDYGNFQFVPNVAVGFRLDVPLAILEDISSKYKVRLGLLALLDKGRSYVALRVLHYKLIPLKLRHYPHAGRCERADHAIVMGQTAALRMIHARIFFD